MSMEHTEEGSEPSFEDSLAALETAVHELEEGRLGLSEALARYEESVKHLRRCYQLLDAAEQKIELLTGASEDGTPCTEPFAIAGEANLESVSRRRKGRSRASPNAAAAGEHDIDGSGGST